MNFIGSMDSHVFKQRIKQVQSSAISNNFILVFLNLHFLSMEFLFDFEYILVLKGRPPQFESRYSNATADLQF